MRNHKISNKHEGGESGKPVKWNENEKIKIEWNVEKQHKKRDVTFCS